uniref:Uncharacterized protein n=1 Tax=Xiphophorus couchianus TaxID=32473 RepID=A0A3B5KRI0_9TELE
FDNEALGQRCSDGDKKTSRFIQPAGWSEKSTWLHPTWLHPTCLHPTCLHPTCLHPTCLHPTWLHPTCLHPTCLHPTCLHPTCLHPTWLHPTCLHPTCLHPTWPQPVFAHGVFSSVSVWLCVFVVLWFSFCSLWRSSLGPMEPCWTEPEPSSAEVQLSVTVVEGSCCGPGCCGFTCRPKIQDESS